MAEPETQEGDLSSEFRDLGKKLVDALRATWESPESKHLQQELETGLSNLADTLRQEMGSFMQTAAGQKLKAEVGDLRERVQSGETETQIRMELLKVLQSLNQELGDAARRWGTGDGDQANNQAASTEVDNG